MPLAARSPRASERDGKEQKDVLRGEMLAVRTTEHGMREYNINKQSFVLPTRYQPTQKLGSGSYGIVVAAEDKENDEKVAIKRCGNVFKHCEDGKRVLREIKMMSMLDHRNVLPIRDIFVSSTNFEDVYVVTPCLNTDLAKLIKSYRLSEQHVKYIMYQILRGLKYVHTANILHRDLKPANVLVNYDCHVKLCDFGLARGYDPNQKVDMTSYIVTRWYRAPELLLQNTNYGPAVDIWAAGCIFAEMLIGKPLFQGNSSIEQLQLICASTAIPDTKDLWWVQSPKMRQYLNQTRVEREGLAVKDLKSLLSRENVAPAHHPGLVSPLNPQALDMLQKMLAFSPYQRWSAEYLLDHPYLSEMKSGRHHEAATHKFKWKYDCVRNLQKPELRKLFWQELVRFQPDCKFAPPGTHPGTPVAIKVSRQESLNANDENSNTHVNKQTALQSTRSIA